MKKNIIVFLATIFVCLSCSWNEESEYSKTKKAYRQIYGEPEDSAFIGSNTNNTWVFSSSSDEQNLSNSAIYPDSVKCNLLVEGRLIVDGGASTDISDTYVTVEKITIRAWIDGRNDVMVFCPKIEGSVAEPENVMEWDAMPECVRYRRKLLSAEPMTITYKDFFYAEVEVCYILRIRDTKLAADCTADRYWNTVRCKSSSLKESLMSVLVPLELVSIQFNATVTCSASGQNVAGENKV